MASWGGGRLRVRSSINYAEDEHEDGDARGEEEGAEGLGSLHEESGLPRRGAGGGSSSANACRQARHRPTQRAGKKVFGCFQPKLKVRPFRQQLGKNGSSRSVVHTNRTAYTAGDTARFFARPPTKLCLPPPTVTCFGEETTDVFKRARDGTVDGDDSLSIDEILRILHRLEEHSKTPTSSCIKRRRPIAVPPWKRKGVLSADAARSPEKNTEDLETPETKPCIVSLGKVDGTTAGISGAVNAAAASDGTTMNPTLTKKARHRETSALLARRRIKTEEDSTEPQQQQQPQERLGTGAAAAAAASSVGEGAAPCPPSVKIFDTVVVKQPYEGGNRLAWRGPSSPNANETKPRRIASGPPRARGFVTCRQTGVAPKTESTNDDLRLAGRPSHSRAGGAIKAELRSDDDLRCAGGTAHGRASGAPKAESRSGDVLREAAASVVRLVVKEPPVAAADRSMAADYCGGRCERCNGKCDRRRPDAAVVRDPSVNNRGSMPPPPEKAAAVATAPSIESSLTESSRAESLRTEASRTELSRTESSRTESSRTESSRTESSRTESLRTESSRTESSRTESSETEPSSCAGLASGRLPPEHNKNNNDNNELEEGEILKDHHHHHRLEGEVFDDHYHHHHRHHHRLPRSPIKGRRHHFPPRPPIEDRHHLLSRPPMLSPNSAR